MSRAAFMRHFQDRLGRSALDLLTDLRMSPAANELKKPAISTEAVAETVGYQSVSAFRRVLAERMGMTPGEWRRLVHDRTWILERSGLIIIRLILSGILLSQSSFVVCMHGCYLGTEITLIRRHPIKSVHQLTK